MTNAHHHLLLTDKISLSCFVWLLFALVWWLESSVVVWTYTCMDITMAGFTKYGIKTRARIPHRTSLWCACFTFLLWLGKANRVSLTWKKTQKMNTGKIEWVMCCSWFFTASHFLRSSVHTLIFCTIELQVLLWMTLITCNTWVWYCFFKV